MRVRRLAGLILALVGASILALLVDPFLRHGVNGETMYSAGMAVDLIVGMLAVIAVACGTHLALTTRPAEPPK